MSKDLIAAKFSFPQWTRGENETYLVLSISIGVKIKLIESLHIDTSLYLMEHQSHGVQNRNR